MKRDCREPFIVHGLKIWLVNTAPFTAFFSGIKRTESELNAVKPTIDPSITDLSYAPNSTVKTITQQQKNLSELEIQTICERYKNGASSYELAKEFGCHRRTISDTLKRNGVEVSHQATTKPELVKKIIELYAEMKTPKEVGAIVGIGGDTIRKVLKENGIYIRKSWEYPKK
ncbi:hypothetical protein QJ036_11595 [Ruminococcus sp. YH-rum2234]|uniref:Transposase IS30-like HTH domain-containing protein n=1 Tax=Fusibacillus kribbianus TaxID=3044208 RepID=A0AAP4BC11_9FIRM|nr:hypothetical protein [Ruminococcus sp. YH-rum2234]